MNHAGHNPYTLADHELETLLQEDQPYGDATTHALGIGAQPGAMHFVARQEMVVCGSEEAQRMAELRGLQIIDCQRIPASGTRIAAGTRLMTLQGPAQGLHAVWKTAQTLIEYLSGIATAAAALVAAARCGNPEVSVACTRKNFPGSKRLTMKAILAGGAVPHRLGLSETLLVFPEHRLFLGSESPETTLTKLRRQWRERQVIVESGDLDEAMRWIAAGVDVLQTEKLPPEAVALLVECARQQAHPPLIAVGGGVTVQNAAAYAQTGAGVLVSSAPYFATPKDVSVTFHQRPLLELEA
jgi:molybdenum transport protein